MQHLDDGLLHALVDGEVPSSELGPIQEHLVDCADCRVRLDEARAIAGESNGLIELIEVPPATHSAGLRPASRKAGTWVRPLALAASLGLAVGLGYAGGRLQAPPAREPMLQVDTLSLSTDAADARVGAKDEPEGPEPTGQREPASGPAQAVPTPGRASASQAQAQEQSDLRQSVVPEEEADRAAAPAPAPPQGRERQARDSAGGRDQFRPNEMVVTGSEARRLDAVGRVANRSATDSMLKRALNEGAAKSAPAAPQTKMEDVVTSLRVVPITFTDAVTLLGGQIRLIDGMVPLRLEASGSAVRVVYPLERGELILEQRRVADSVAVSLIAPTLSPDSLGRLRQRIR